MFTNDTSNQQVLDLMSYILIETKKTKEGIQIFNALLKEQPANNNLNIILGNFYIAEHDTINALSLYTKALKNDENNPQVIEIIARLRE